MANMLEFVADYVKGLKAGQGISERGLPAPPIGGRAASKRILGNKFIRKDQYGVDNFEDYFSESSISICPPADNSDDSELRAKKRRKKIAVPEYSAWSSRRDSSNASIATSQETCSHPSAAASTINSEAESATTADRTPADRTLTGATPAAGVDHEAARVDHDAALVDHDAALAMATDGAKSKTAPPQEPATVAQSTTDEPWVRLEMPPDIALGLLPRSNVRLQHLQNLPHLQPPAAWPASPKQVLREGRLQSAAAAATASSAAVGHFQPSWIGRSTDEDIEAADGRVFSSGSADLTPSPELTPIPALGATLRVRRSMAFAGELDLGTAEPCYSSVHVVGSPRSRQPQQQRHRHRRHVAESTRMSTAGFVELAGRTCPGSGPLAAARDAMAASDVGRRQSTRSANKLPVQQQQQPAQVRSSSRNGSSSGTSFSAAVHRGKASTGDSSCAATGSVTATATDSRSASSLSAMAAVATPCAPRKSGSLMDVRSRELYPVLEAAYSGKRQNAGHDGGKAALFSDSAMGGSGTGAQRVPSRRLASNNGSSYEGPSVSEPDDCSTWVHASQEPAQLEDGSDGSASGTYLQPTPGSRLADRACAVMPATPSDRSVVTDVLGTFASHRQLVRATPGSQHCKPQEGCGRDEGGAPQAHDHAEDRTGYDGRRLTKKRRRPSTPGSAADSDARSTRLAAVPESQSPPSRRGSIMRLDDKGGLSAKGKLTLLPRKPAAEEASGLKGPADRLSPIVPTAVAAAVAAGPPELGRSARKAAAGEPRTALDANGTSAKAAWNALPPAGPAGLSSASRTTLGHSRRSVKDSTLSRRSAAQAALTSSRVSAASILESQRAQAHGRRVSKRLYTPADAHLEAVDDGDEGDADDAGSESNSAPAHLDRSLAAAHRDADANDGSELGTQQRSAASGSTAKQRNAAAAAASQGRATTERRGRGRPPKKAKAVPTSRTDASLSPTPIDRPSATQPRLHKKQAGLHRDRVFSPAQTQSPSACAADASLPSCSALPVHYHETTHSSPATLRGGYCGRRVRVVVPDENPSDGIRRSKRVRVQTLRWDLFERIEYAPGHGGFLGVVRRDDIVQAPPIQKKKKKKAGRGKHSPAETLAAPQGNSQEFTEPLAEAGDSILDGCISIVNPRTNQKERLDCIFSQKQHEYDQPMGPDGLPATYKIGFRFRVENNFAVGQIILEPGGVKGECCCNKELFFTVTMGRVEVKINESVNKLVHRASFRVPEGNLYSIRNLSTRHAASLDFTKVNLGLVKTKDTSDNSQDETRTSCSQSIDDGIGY